MSRIARLLRNEFNLARSAGPIHAIALIQPALFFLLLSVILVHPTMKMNICWPTGEPCQRLTDALKEVGAPNGPAYVDVNPVPADGVGDMRQLILVQEGDPDEVPTAVQRYGLIDSNQVKNLRNRLTAAGLLMWNEALGSRGVTVEEHTWLPYDVPYPVYFGVAMLPLAAFLAAVITGAALTAQDFEFGTALIYRLSPAPAELILGARLIRLALTGLLGAGVAMVAIGLRTAHWPADPLRLVLVLSAMGLLGGCCGVTAGLLLQRTIPAFVVGLVLAILGWIFGEGFVLAAGLGGPFEAVSRLSPNSHAVELLFPAFYGLEVGEPVVSAAVLVGFCVAACAVTALLFWRRLMKAG